MSISDVNKAYYGITKPGQLDYWNKMAAPKHRLEILRRETLARSPTALGDLGCGNGALLSCLQPDLPNTRMCGFDFSEKQLDANRAAMQSIEWIQSDLSKPDLVPENLRGKFDLLIASEIVEHIVDPAQFLLTARHLGAATVGHLILSTQTGPVRETEKRVGHHRHFKHGEITKLLRETGWEPLRVWNTGFPFHDLSKWYANISPDRSMARFSDKPYGLGENLICALLQLAFKFNSSKRGAQLFAVAKVADR